MRHRLAFASLPAAVIGLAWACTSPPAINNAPKDGGSDANEEGDDTGLLPDIGSGNPDAAACASQGCCQLANGTDPVALCVQQTVIGQEIQYAYTKGHGVAPGWASTAPYAQLQGHDWQDDLALAGALGAYYCSAEAYGNAQITTTVEDTLADLSSVLVAELKQVPSPIQGTYDGEVYFRLRWAQAALNYVDDANAQAVAGFASAYGTQLATQDVYPVPAAGGDAGSPGGMVIGTLNIADGSVTYAPAQSMMAAAALLDMAVQQLGSPAADAGQGVAWVIDAQQVIAYLLARARDPVTGLFYQSLTTSGDPGHDTVGAGTPTNDSMLTETQAWIMLALARAQDLLIEYQTQTGTTPGLPDGSLPDEDPYWVAGVAVGSALAGAHLFDGPPSDIDAGVPPVGALMEGIILSSQQLLTDKTTIGNAIMLGGFHRVSQGEGSLQSYELGEIRSALGGVPEGTLQLAHTSLLSIVTDANGDLIQQAYLRAGSKDYGYALAYEPGAEPVEQGQEPGATNYLSAANHAMIEGITQLWVGAANDTRCVP